MDKRIIASFESQVYAQEAVRELINKDLNTEDISLISNAQKNEQYQILDSMGHNLAVGNIGAISFGTNSEAQLIQINNNESIMVSGPLSGIFELNPADGVSGALSSYGLNPEQSRHFAENIQKGKTLAVTRAEDDQLMEITNTLRNHGAQEIASYIEYNDGIG